MIAAIVGNNETDSDGVAVKWTGKTISITTVGATDVVTLLIAGRG